MDNSLCIFKHQRAYIIHICVIVQDLGDDGKVYNSLLNTIVRYVRQEFPENIQFIEEEHDISLVLGEF